MSKLEKIAGLGKKKLILAVGCDRNFVGGEPCLGTLGEMAFANLRQAAFYERLHVTGIAYADERQEVPRLREDLYLCSLKGVSGEGRPVLEVELSGYETGERKDGRLLLYVSDKDPGNRLSRFPVSQGFDLLDG